MPGQCRRRIGHAKRALRAAGAKGRRRAVTVSAGDRAALDDMIQYAESGSGRPSSVSKHWTTLCEPSATSCPGSEPDRCWPGSQAVSLARSIPSEQSDGGQPGAAR